MVINIGPHLMSLTDLNSLELLALSVMTNATSIRPLSTVRPPAAIFLILIYLTMYQDLSEPHLQIGTVINLAVSFIDMYEK